jgi:hypothetical protein
MAGQNDTDGGTSIGLICRNFCIGGGSGLFLGTAAGHQRQGHQQAQNQSKKSFHRGSSFSKQKKIFGLQTQHGEH